MVRRLVEGWEERLLDRTKIARGAALADVHPRHGRSGPAWDGFGWPVGNRVGWDHAGSGNQDDIAPTRTTAAVPLTPTGWEGGVRRR